MNNYKNMIKICQVCKQKAEITTDKGYFLCLKVSCHDSFIKEK